MVVALPPLGPAHAGLVACVVSTYVLSTWMGVKVGGARKKYGCKYPAMYLAGESAAANAFNCIQRGHQNTLEQIPTFLSFLAVAGARFPGAAALAGAAFLVGRVFYFKGYASGDPKKRISGPAPVQYLGLLALLVMNIRFGVELVRSA